MTAITRPLPRAALRALRAYSLPVPVVTPLARVDQNENPFDFPTDLKREVLRRVEARAWNRYPDLSAERLRTAIGASYGIAPEKILVGNGSDDLLLAAFLAFVDRRRDVITFAPSFGLYATATTIAGGLLRTIPIDASTGRLPIDEALRTIERCPAQPLVVLASLNNPTGGVATIDDIERLLSTGALVFLDRAYGEFTNDDLVLQIAKSRNREIAKSLVVFSTFSKAWGLAAMRVGWLTAAEEVCREIAKVKLPYNVSVADEEAAIVALENRARLDARAAEILTLAAELERELRSIDGVSVFPSKANFFCLTTPLEATALRERLAARGVVVRDLSATRGYERAIRISAGTREENRVVVAALREILEVIA